ncbi:mitochondrial carrier protein RIM2 [Neoconidiobolus thromboides FSU 785]|nr:mitochondrial carrier protein RIM2 [Neoconidiobolus thromboides FSU 785]
MSQNAYNSTIINNQTKSSATAAIINKQPFFKLDNNAALHFIAGGVGGSIGTIIFSPLEVIKTRFQSSLYQENKLKLNQKLGLWNSTKFHIADTLSSVRNLYRNEGFKALFKGLGPTLSGVIPSRSIYFFSYGNGKKMLSDLNGGKENALIHLSSATIAGIITATATNPIWVIRTRMQLQNETGRLYNNSFHCLYQIVRKEGVKSLYKGMSASYLGVVESATQWVVYEQLKVLRGIQSTSDKNQKDKTMNEWMETLLCAGSAKLIAALVAYPHEVLRTRLRQNPVNSNGTYKYNGLISSIKLIYKEEGMVGLYGGLTPHLLRVVPNAAVLFGTYEMIMYYFSKK